MYVKNQLEVFNMKINLRIIFELRNINIISDHLTKLEFRITLHLRTFLKPFDLKGNFEKSMESNCVNSFLSNVCFCNKTMTVFS